MSVRAKMVCQDIKREYGNAEVTLTCIYSDSGENADFTAATPYGMLRMGIYPEDRPAIKYLVPGKSYYIDITEVPE